MEETPEPAHGRARPEEPPESVPLQDLSREYRALEEELTGAVSSVAASGRFVLGERLEAFEEAAADYLGTRHAVGVASGSDALQLALEALGVGEGDEVVTSPFTFFASVEAILQAGAVPVLADIRPGSYNLDPAAVEAAVTPRTAAIMPVHLYGQMADMEALGALADRHGLAVVEDAAQAFGAARRRDGEWVRAGADGTAGCFSFFPTKNLGAWGEGGLVSTDDAKLAERIRRLRNHGEERRYHHAELGRNSRLDALQAAVLHVKLPHLDEWNARRRAHAARYDRALEGASGIRAPVEGRGNRHIYHQYTVRCARRARVRERLERAGVGYGIYYPVPAHLQEPLAGLGYRKGEFPEAEEAAEQVLSLPVFPELTGSERDRVVAALLDHPGGRG